MLPAVGDLAGQQRGEVLLVRPVRIPCLVGELLPAGCGGGDPQDPGQVGQLRGQALRARDIVVEAMLLIAVMRERPPR